MKNFLVLALAAGLAACGGGGGGDAPSGGTTTPPGTGVSVPVPSPGKSPTGLAVTFSTSALAFEFAEGSEPPAQVIHASAAGTTDKDILMGAEVSGIAISNPLPVLVDTIRRTATIDVKPHQYSKPGTYTGTIKLMACTTQDCSVHHAGSPHTVNYTVIVNPGLKPSATFVNLATVESGSSAVSEVTFAPPAGVAVNANVIYSGAQTGWLSAQISSNVLRLQGSAASLVSGTYKASVALARADGKQTVQIPVTFYVDTGLSMPPGVSVKIDSSSSAQQLEGAIELAAKPGSASTGWTAVSDQPWLTLKQGSGAYGTAPVWRIDVDAFSKLANNQHHLGVVRIGSSNTLPARTFTVDVHKALAEIKGLDSLALMAGQSGDMLVYGSGFNTLASGTGAVSVAGAKLASVERLSDTVLRVSLPVMAAGSYSVSLNSASGATAPAKQLNVLGRLTYDYTSLPSPGRKGAMVWDALTQSVFVLNRSLKTITRYAPVAGKFQLAATRAFPYVDSIAMTPDRSALVLSSGASKVYKLSPLDLSTLTTFDLRKDNLYSESTLFMPLMITGDNRLFNAPYGWLDLDSGASTPLVYISQPFNTTNDADYGVMSGNGKRVLWPEARSSGPYAQMRRIDLSEGKFLFSGPRLSDFRQAVANHDGSKWAISALLVIGFDQSVLGNIDFPEGWYGNRGAFSRSGARLYYYASQDRGNDKPRVYVFDTSKAVGPDADFPVLGYIEFNDLPHCADYKNFSDNCSPYETAVTISSDDQTVFVAGDARFTVVPVPPALRAPLVSHQASAMAPGAARISLKHN